MAYNGFFGQISGPFRMNEDVYQKIVLESNQNMSHISKIGIHYPVNFDYPLIFYENNNLEINESSFCFPIIVELNDAKDKNSVSSRKQFRLGRNGILELQNVKITNIVFKNNVDENIYIDFQYEISSI